MEKILIRLEVPSVNACYDVFIPRELKIGALTALLADCVSNITEGRYKPSGEEMLCFFDQRKVLDPALTAEEYGISNGDRLIML